MRQPCRGRDESWKETSASWILLQGQRKERHYLNARLRKPGQVSRNARLSVFDLDASVLGGLLTQSLWTWHQHRPSGINWIDRTAAADCRVTGREQDAMGPNCHGQVTQNASDSDRNRSAVKSDQDSPWSGACPGSGLPEPATPALCAHYVQHTAWHVTPKPFCRMYCLYLTGQGGMCARRPGLGRSAESIRDRFLCPANLLTNGAA